MVLSGWKEISQYLGCGVRTAQRWEHAGLPIHRPLPGGRSHIVADTKDLDSWLQIQRRLAVEKCRSPGSSRTAHKLRADLHKARQMLHERMEALSKEVAAVCAGMEQLQRELPYEGRAKNQRSQGA
jgi:CHAD domain-containing protein